MDIFSDAQVVFAACHGQTADVAMYTKSGMGWQQNVVTSGCIG